jgi:hypothetical protein
VIAVTPAAGANVTERAMPRFAAKILWRQALIRFDFRLSAAVAPLTTAVLSDVEARYTGVASGLNSAVARTGGLPATAMVGFVFASHGIRLLRSFHVTMAVGAAVCGCAALTACALVRGRSAHQAQ